MITGIIGLGLIGGSFAFSLKKHNLTNKVLGFDINGCYQKQALDMGFVDDIANLEELSKSADLIIVTTPVNTVAKIINQIIPNIKKNAVIMDMSSTKETICNAINSKRFVATHPMWGTEKSGPTAAQKDAFIDKTVVICNKEDSDADALELVENIYKTIGMQVLYMGSKEHDVHAAYVSHISHISSFALSLATLNKCKEKQNYIKEMASTGFASTARLAKSSPTTWSSIFIENKANVLDVLDEYISQINYLKELIINEDEQALKQDLLKANAIKEIIG